MKIVVLDGHTFHESDGGWEAFKKLGDVTVYERTADAEVLPRIQDADMVLINKALLTREILTACPSLRYIGVLATGYNTVDLEAAAECGITVTNIPAYSTMAVAQMVFALLLELCSRVADYNHDSHNGEWTASPDFCYRKYPLVELDGKTMGLVGFGQIGQSVAAIARSFGMRVLYTARHDHHSERGEYVSLEDLLAQSDVISLHCPLTAENAGMINAETLRKMKKSAILINTARGGLLVEQDVADALQNGTIASAAVDVASAEPILADNPLLGAPNCLITPHVAWATREAIQRLMKIAVQNMENFLAGRECNRVN